MLHTLVLMHIDWSIVTANHTMFRPVKVDLQFIVRAFPKMHAGGRSFFISFGPAHVATETII